MLEVKHQVSVFVSFLLLPLAYLLSFGGNGSTPRQILSSLGGIDKGFLEGILLYLVFTFYVFIYFLMDPDFFDRYEKAGFALLVSLMFTSLNVMPLDFFTKRFIQFPLSKSYGSRVAIFLQTLIWLGAHYPESLWLNELMGDVGVWVFLAFTGIISGISYERTKNVIGLMAGHVLINACVLIMANT